MPLNADEMFVLKKRLGIHRECVFTSQDHLVVNVSTKAWESALRRAGVKNFRWHDLRHTLASWHVQSGTSLHELQMLGAWRSFSMVLRYAHLSSSHLQQAASRIGVTNSLHV